MSWFFFCFVYFVFVGGGGEGGLGFCFERTYVRLLLLRAPAKRNKRSENDARTTPPSDSQNGEPQRPTVSPTAVLWPPSSECRKLLRGAFKGLRGHCFRRRCREHPSPIGAVTCCCCVSRENYSITIGPILKFPIHRLIFAYTQRMYGCIICTWFSLLIFFVFLLFLIYHRWRFVGSCPTGRKDPSSHCSTPRS